MLREDDACVQGGDFHQQRKSHQRILPEAEAAHSNIRDFSVRHDADGATLTGSVTRLIPVHFTIKGPVSTDGNSIRLTEKSIKADGLPIKEMLKLVGAKLNSVIPVRGLKGIEIGDDYLSFSPDALANLKGHIMSVTTSSLGLTLRYAPYPSTGRIQRKGIVRSLEQ